MTRNKIIARIEVRVLQKHETREGKKGKKGKKIDRRRDDRSIDRSMTDFF